MFNTSGGGAVNIPNRDPNCVSYVNNVCSQCSNRYYLGTSGSCVPVNPLCQSYNSTGACTGCYPGYTLNSGVCGVAFTTDPNCKTLNANAQCLQCYTGFYYNSTRNLCVALNPLCKTSDLTNGNCLTCYPGYSLSSGTCGVFFKDPNCLSYDSSNNCNQCSSRYFLDPTSGQCKSISPLCNGFNSQTGVCLNCYTGYTLQNGACVIGTSTTLDPNCKTFNGNTCTQCY